MTGEVEYITIPVTDMLKNSTLAEIQVGGWQIDEARQFVTLVRSKRVVPPTEGGSAGPIIVDNITGEDFERAVANGVIVDAPTQPILSIVPPVVQEAPEVATPPDTDSADAVGDPATA